MASLQIDRKKDVAPMEAYNSSVSFVNSAEINKNASGTSQVSNGVGGGVISTTRDCPFSSITHKESRPPVIYGLWRRSTRAWNLTKKRDERRLFIVLVNETDRSRRSKWACEFTTYRFIITSNRLNPFEVSEWFCDIKITITLKLNLLKLKLTR